MAEFVNFRDHQARLSLVAEKERSIELRRKVLQELTQSVQQLTDECDKHEELLRQERAHFTHRKALQDEKVAAKEAQVRNQHEHLAALEAEETRLHALIAEREADIQQVQQDTALRQKTAARVRESRDTLTRLKKLLEERDAQVLALERRAGKLLEAAERRHILVAERVGDLSLSRIEAAGHGGLEETAGESIMLINEFN
ncbi:hypothetical protein ERJ75_000745700 [Trypanosoma vivax]|uniref:Uncharacterized protein n=1 Tax=Trypanosoma vivax (strain Y486) TaxID=1055687 RepID=G0U0A3_TRYVY|nr:hypothetical protein TRVL_04320 [Trypanosoma vivax]KAH8614107.1 hypothetical protein ERJ75_000745700 [Trypanosoma vivax]CCC49501.1 conserved hypothetical protein [Trypanosoma vivax Y486]